MDGNDESTHDLSRDLAGAVVDGMWEAAEVRLGAVHDVTLPGEVVGGLLQTAMDRAGDGGKMVAAGLLRGQSWRMAAACAGLDDETVKKWCKKDQILNDCLNTCFSLGFSRTFESELYNRALAGSEDRGSIRALEMVVKARAPEYRDKAQVQMDVVHRAVEAGQALTAGWQDEESN